MFILVDSKGNPAKNREGHVFTYSLRWTAQLGKKLVETETGVKYTIEEVGK